MSTPRSFAKRSLRGPVFGRLLEPFGIEPRRFWILVDLFSVLSKRQELKTMGSKGFSLHMTALLGFGLSGLVSVFMAVGGVAPDLYLLIFLGITALVGGVFFLPEVTESLVNPVEGHVLAPLPVNGATWLSAKLAHLLRVVMFVVAGVNAIPAIVGLLFLEHEGHAFWYLALHLLSALGVGVTVALLCCSLVGWLVRFFPVKRIKGVAAIAQILPYSMMWMLHMRTVVSELFERLEAAWTNMLEQSSGLAWVANFVPGGFPTILATVGVVVVATAGLLGLQVLSRDHLIRSSTLVHAGSATRRLNRKVRVSGRWLTELLGGQTGRAGFEYTLAMMLRDWQFKKHFFIHVFPFVGASILLLVGNFVFGHEFAEAPFGAGFTFACFIPVCLGLGADTTCLILNFGDDHKAVPTFLAAPNKAFLPFARGVHAALWIGTVALPSAIALAVLPWIWGVADAALLVCFSAMTGTWFLASSLSHIDGVPFSKQLDPDQRLFAYGHTFISLAKGALLLGVAVLLFRHAAAAAAATLVGAAGAWVVTGRAISRFGPRIQVDLRLTASRMAGRGTEMFRSVD